MASGWTNYAVNKILEVVLRGTSFTFPTNFYIGIFTTDPTDSTGGTEFTGYGSRKAIAVGSAAWNALSGGSTASAIDNQLTASATGGTSGANITSYGLFDASTAGNLWFWANVTTANPIVAGNPVDFPIGNITIAAI